MSKVCESWCLVFYLLTSPLNSKFARKQLVFTQLLELLMEIYTLSTDGFNFGNTGASDHARSGEHLNQWPNPF